MAARLDTNIYDAVDGERDVIRCWNLKTETVRADPLDAFSTTTYPDGLEEGGQHCDSLTIVE